MLRGGNAVLWVTFKAREEIKQHRFPVELEVIGPEDRVSGVIDAFVERLVTEEPGIRYSGR